MTDGHGARISQSPLNFLGWSFILNAMIFPFTLKLMNCSNVFSRVIKEAKVIFWVGGTLSYIVYAIVVWAFTKAPIPLVGALRESGIIFSIIIFPEGTRKIPGKRVGKFARSAADLAIKNNVDLIPIYHDSGLYWKNKKFIKFPGTVKVIIGTPIQGKNSSEMTKNLVDWMNKKASMSTE